MWIDTTTFRQYAGLGHRLIARLPSVEKGVRVLQPAPGTHLLTAGSQIFTLVMGVQFPLGVPIDAGSFSGKTEAFEASIVGSIPTPATNRSNNGTGPKDRHGSSQGPKDANL